MMIFLGEKYVNLNHIKKLGVNAYGTVDVEFADGSTETFKGGADLTETVIASTMVPALPGFSLLTLDVSDAKGPQQLIEETIIAFRVPNSGDTPIPVSLQGEAGRGSESKPWANQWAVKRPDGTVTNPYDTDFANPAEYLNEMKRRWQENMTKSPA